MAMKRLSMRQIRQVLRLRLEHGLTTRAIARACSVGLGTVTEYLTRAREAGLEWPLPEELDDGALEVLLYPRGPDSSGPRPLPDFAAIHKELRRRYSTLSFSTVYNTLGMLEKINEVQSVHVFDDYLNYDPIINPHIHFYCKGCGMIYDIMLEGRDDVSVPRKEIEGFLIDSIGLVFKGTCKHCR